MTVIGLPLKELATGVGGLLLLWGSMRQFFPRNVEYLLLKWCNKVVACIFPRFRVTVDEFLPDGRSNETYDCIKNYLGAECVNKAESLRAEKSRNSKSVEFGPGKYSEILDEFQGVRIKWAAHQETIKESSSFRTGRPFEKRCFVLEVHRKHRQLVVGDYLNHVMETGNAIEFKNRKRRLYTNNKDKDSYWRGRWNYINFQHPATFDTLAMDPLKKKEIIDDLLSFKNGKDYYKKIGKPWKRGYLLHGPPGTGKSTMIAAMTNFLDYDIYDIELTSVMENAELKQLLIETSSKSIMVIEDIDCSLDLTGARTNKKKGKDESEDEMMKQNKREDQEKKSRVTLSGVLNFIDGIWSACGEERIIVFTTNHVKKLDPALIRRGRMDLRIEMSYCDFEAFKVLAKNYLDMDSHPLFGEIRQLLEEYDVCPCDVAENLIPKGESSDHKETCLMGLIEAIKNENKKKHEVVLKEEVQDGNAPNILED